MATFEQILADLKKKIYAPVYFLSGEEPYYIDQLSDYIETHVLAASEKEFNQNIFYGKDLDVRTLLSHARRYPMMSNYQVVMVKEAQDLKGLVPSEKDDKDQKNVFLEYLLKPTPSTILVLCYKYKSLDKRTRYYKALEKNSVFFNSKRLYDNQLPNWIQQLVLSKGFRIQAKALAMLSEYLGNDLSKIANEIDKLCLNLKPGEEIISALVEDNIGISKDFNIFELLNALGSRNIYKANQIVHYFTSNTKNNPLIMTIPQLHSYFMKILMLQKAEGKSKNEIASSLGISPYFVQDYQAAAREYSGTQVMRNLSLIQDYDLRLKGINNLSTDEGSLLRELVFKILH